MKHFKFSQSINHSKANVKTGLSDLTLPLIELSDSLALKSLDKYKNLVIIPLPWTHAPTVKATTRYVHDIV